MRRRLFWHVVFVFSSVYVVLQQAGDPYADFKRIFDKFATAEQVTGAAPLESDEDAEPGDEVKVGTVP